MWRTGVWVSVFRNSIIHKIFSEFFPLCRNLTGLSVLSRGLHFLFVCEQTGWLFINKSPCSNFHEFTRFPLLRRPNLVKIPLWVSWWVSIQNRSPCSLRLFIVWAQRSLTIFNLWAPRWRRRRTPPLILIKSNWFRSLFSRFTVETVHICFLICSVWYTKFSDIFWTLQAMGNRSGFPVQFCPSRCTSPQSSQFWAANHDMLSLSGSDREFHQISFWDISSAHCELWHALSVLQFCRAEHLEVAPSWRRSSRLRKRPLAIEENVGWLHFLSRDVHKCYRQFLDSKKEGIPGIALLELFRIARTTLHCPLHESSLLNLHSMGCRRYFVANRLEVLVDEDDSRSSSRVREHEIFSACFTTACGNPDTLKSMSISSSCVNKPMDCPLTSLSVLIDQRLRFRLCLCLYLHVQQTLAHKWKTSLPVLSFFFFGEYHLFRIVSFRVDFRCVHRLQLLKVCNQYVTFPISHRVQNAYPRNNPGKTFFPNWWILDWSSAEIG